MLGRFMKSVIQPVELGVETHLKKVRAEEARVNDLARLLDADRKFVCVQSHRFLVYVRMQTFLQSPSTTPNLHCLYDH